LEAITNHLRDHMTTEPVPTEPPTTTPTRRLKCPELQTMDRIGGLLEGLDETELNRVLAWVFSRYAPGNTTFSKQDREVKQVLVEGPVP
jgi:hypothetical protein